MWKLELLNTLDMGRSRSAPQFRLERIQLRALPFRHDFHGTVIKIARHAPRDAELPRLLQDEPAKSDALNPSQDAVARARHVPLTPAARPVRAADATTRSPAPRG